MTWELDLGKPERYFTEEQLKQIIESANGQYSFPLRTVSRYGDANW